MPPSSRSDAWPSTRAQARDKLRDVCGDDRDTRLFLGNIFSHQQVFTIAGLWFPKKREHKQLDVFS